MLQSLCALITKQENEAAYTLYAQAGLQGGLDLAAILSWRVGMRDYCTDRECLQSGFSTALAGSLVNILGTSLVCALYWHYKPYFQPFQLIQRRKWTHVGVLSCQLLCFLLVLLSIGWPEWIQGAGWSGGLLQCQDCPYQAQRVGWDCYAGPLCTNSQANSPLCSLFSSLRDSGFTVFPT